MSIFGNILQKLGIKKADSTVAVSPAPVHIDAASIAAAHASTAAAAAAKAVQQAAQHANVTPAGFTPPAAVAPKPAAIPVVDVVSKLDQLAKVNPQKLDWKVSIVDMLKLLDIDSSLDSRKALAVELGCPADKMGGDYSAMNVWLHQTVLQKIAENGGNIPASLLNK
jgi:hypothetical protein